VEVRQFRQYLDLLILWNRSQRLTGVLSPTAIIEELFEDSLLFLSRLPRGKLKIADLGAGAGIPGVPLAIVRPEISMTLIEAKRKRVSFLSALKRELGATNLEILEGRAESLIEGNSGLGGRFDVVVSRAVGPIRALLPIAMAYLTSGGLLLVAGSPSHGQQPAPDEFGIRREVIKFAEIGRRRTFLLATKGRF
jgi:16S rRNA (guanine527-N7)-methyltransferase